MHVNGLLFDVFTDAHYSESAQVEDLPPLPFHPHPKLRKQKKKSFYNQCSIESDSKVHINGVLCIMKIDLCKISNVKVKYMC